MSDFKTATVEFNVEALDELHGTLAEAGLSAFLTGTQISHQLVGQAGVLLSYLIYLLDPDVADGQDEVLGLLTESLRESGYIR